jgi:hypothetical protein
MNRGSVSSKSGVLYELEWSSSYHIDVLTLVVLCMIYNSGYPNFTQTQTRNCGYPKLRVPESSGTSSGSTVGNPKYKKPKKPNPKFWVNPNARS